MLRQRVLTAVVGIPALAALVYLGGLWLFGLVVLLGLVAFHEYAKLWTARGVHVPYWPGALGCLLLWGWSDNLGRSLKGSGGEALGAARSWAALSPSVTLVLVLVVVGVMVYQVLNFGEMDFTGVTATVFGVAYLGLGFGHLLLLRAVAYVSTPAPAWWGLAPVALAFLCTWAADTVAYQVGMTWGRHKLAPKVSPGKSWEGGVAGTLAAALVGLALAPVLGWSRPFGFSAGLLLAVAGAFGDLAESSLKRYCGLKDSGTLLPGHGGILDRFDSSLFVMPLAFYIVLLFPAAGPAARFL